MPTETLLKYKMFGFFFIESVSITDEEVFFLKQPMGAPLNTSKFYDVLVGFDLSVLLYLRLLKGGCCSLSDDLSC